MLGRRPTGEAALGQFRAGIVDGRVNDLVVAALDQHIGDRIREHLAPGDRHQMRLALAACVLDQRRVVEPHRLRQHGTGDLDDVVEGQRPDGLRRRGVDRRQTVGEQGSRGNLDVPDQALEHVVEQGNLLV
jgi:hypothetical protein